MTSTLEQCSLLFRLQKYKKFESNSQHLHMDYQDFQGCFDCKSTKNLRAIHNQKKIDQIAKQVVSTAKVQKIWEQFTTAQFLPNLPGTVVSTAKVQKIWEQFTTYAGHQFNQGRVVSTAKVQKIWEQFTTCALRFIPFLKLFRLQKYKKFESNSQRLWLTY